MRISVYLSPEMVTRLKELAWAEHRYPRQRAEHLLQQAIQQTAIPLPTTSSKECPHDQEAHHG